mgnify:CR=1 FL=1
MNNLSIIIHQNQNLFELLKEIKLDQQYNLVHVNSSIEEIIDKLKAKNKEYLVISNHDKIECDNKKLILIKKPIKISSLLEKISLLFVKNKYSITSNISIGKYKVNLNSRQISLNNNQNAFVVIVGGRHNQYTAPQQPKCLVIQSPAGTVRTGIYSNRINYYSNKVGSTFNYSLRENICISN